MLPFVHLRLQLSPGALIQLHGVANVKQLMQSIICPMGFSLCATVQASVSLPVHMICKQCVC